MGLTIKPHFWWGEGSPLDAIRWEERHARIDGPDGTPVFEQPSVLFPPDWSQTAVNIVASKYFRGSLGNEEERESSLATVIRRVAGTIQHWGVKGNYFSSITDAANFGNELQYILVNQIAAFNSPVWFNVGVEPNPQCSACFINEVEDTLESIMELAATEARIFKGGSGAGVNLSPIRSRVAGLSGGGIASGPVSFMRGFDSFAGVIKSGGKTRRAAKMTILNADHPDIEEFIWCKAKEENKAHDLISLGYDGSLDGEAYSSVYFQNTNNSVRVSKRFMEAVVDGYPKDEHKYTHILQEMAQAAWKCGDPGIQYDDTINKWHTCATTDRIYASNPCSEFMFLNNTACNLASINLMKFLNHDGTFDVEGFKHTVDIMILAQEILVDNASYPTKKIETMTKMYRPLGLGYANLGAYLMARGLPYDSEEARIEAADITSRMSAVAYRMSALIAKEKGSFRGFHANAADMHNVIQMHHSVAVEQLNSSVWQDTVDLGLEHGFRNSQVTVLAPTGTIAFMMDCDTTGIEPDFALVKTKKLVGGGEAKIINRSVDKALKTLGYGRKESQEIEQCIFSYGTPKNAPDFDYAAHGEVFACAVGPDAINPMGHVKMMAAVQPFLSGAISKTINMPETATPQDIYDLYVAGWKLGLKSLAVYRDGCKKVQPLSMPEVEKVYEDDFGGEVFKVTQPVRRKLPDERPSITHKFDIGGHEGYVMVGMYEDGTPGEVFITMSKEGSTISGMMDAWSTSISLNLQYGVPLDSIVEKFSFMRFEPSGFTKHAEIKIAWSIVDYVARWLGSRFAHQPKGLLTTEARKEGGTISPEGIETYSDMVCLVCGTNMIRSGACHTCPTCGLQHGCA